MSLRSLEDVFSATTFYLPRRLSSSRRFANTSLRHIQDIFKTSSRHLGRQKIVTLQTSSRRFQDMSCSKICLEVVFQMSWRPTRCLLERNLYLCLIYLNLYLTNLYLTNLYLINLRRIQEKSKKHYLLPNAFHVHRILRFK